MWQSDFCHWPLSDGSTTEIITWLDDHSHCALSVTAHRRITGPIVVETLDQTCADHGFPASTRTDNAMVCTTRLSGGKGSRNALETRLAHLGIAQKKSAPGLDQFTGHSNHARPHRTLGRATPAAAYNRLPKTSPEHNRAD